MYYLMKYFMKYVIILGINVKLNCRYLYQHDKAEVFLFECANRLISSHHYYYRRDPYYQRLRKNYKNILLDPSKVPQK